MAGPTVRYRERLTVSWWLWPCALAVAGLMAAEIHLGYGGVRAWLPYATLLPLTAVLLGWLGRLQVRVTDTELHVDDAHIPLTFLTVAETLDAAATRRALGRDGHPLAFVVRRPWVPTAVRVGVHDPADPTPYWLVSTRRPAALVAALGLADVSNRADEPAPARGVDEPSGAGG
jgi:hypothetical protein